MFLEQINHAPKKKKKRKVKSLHVCAKEHELQASCFSYNARFESVSFNNGVTFTKYIFKMLWVMHELR